MCRMYLVWIPISPLEKIKKILPDSNFLKPKRSSKLANVSLSLCQRLHCLRFTVHFYICMYFKLYSSIEPFCLVCRFVSVYWGICFWNCSIFRLDQYKVVEDSEKWKFPLDAAFLMIHCFFFSFFLFYMRCWFWLRHNTLAIRSASKSKSIFFLFFLPCVFYANAFDCVAVSFYLCALEII